MEVATMLGARLRRRALVGMLLGGCVCGLWWSQRTRLRRLWEIVHNLSKAGQNVARTMELVSRDLFEFLEAKEDRSELPTSLRRLLSVLVKPEVLGALSTLANAVAEGIARQMPRDAEGLQRILGSPECERLTAIVVKTASRELLRGYLQKMDEWGLKGGAKGPFPTLTPDLVGEWLKNDSIRALVVEAAAAMVSASSRPVTPKREFPTYGGKCSAMVSRKSVGRINGMVNSRSAANILPPLGAEKRHDGDLAEKLVLTALRDKDLVRAVASESVRSYLKTKNELHKARSKAPAEATASKGGDGGPDGGAAPKRKESTSWWLTRTLASSAWKYVSTT